MSARWKLHSHSYPGGGAGHAAAAGAASLFLGSTMVWWISGQCVALSICAVGVSVIFTIRPVRLRIQILGGCHLVLNMASVSWLSILWLVILGAMPLKVFSVGILGSPSSQIEPWTMLVVFASAVYLCTSLEVTGFMTATACMLTRSVGRSPSALFLSLAVIASVMTVFVPDDVVTMTLAPTVCILCRNLKRDATPYLFAIFYSANIWAVVLITGNVTNVIVADITDERFLPFAGKMMPCGTVAGICTILLLYFTYLGDLHTSPTVEDVFEASGPKKETGVSHPMRAKIALARFIATFVLAAMDSVTHWPIWLTMAVFAGTSIFIDRLLDMLKVDGESNFTYKVCEKLPYGILLFYMALFVLVEQLIYTGIVSFIAGGFDHVSDKPVLAMTAIGLSSLLVAQVLSSAPMTILFLQVITHVQGWSRPAVGSEQENAKHLALHALVLSSNFCGNVTRMGTMGGQMWVRIAKSHNVQLNDSSILIRGVLIMTPVMVASLIVLYYT